MALVVILEPRRQLGQDGLSVRTIVNIDVVSFEGFDERFGHAVRLRAAHRREARHQPQPDRELDGLVSSIAAAVIRQPLHGMPRSARSEAPFNALEHEIADHLPADTACARAPGHDFPVAGIQREKATRTTWLFQQAISKPSDVQRRFGRMVMIWPSWTRPEGLPVYRCKSIPFCDIRRYTRLWLTRGRLFLSLSRFISAAIRR